MGTWATPYVMSVGLQRSKAGDRVRRGPQVVDWLHHPCHPVQLDGIGVM